MDGVAAPWFAFMAIGTVQHFKAKGASLPPPALYASTSLVFAMLALVAQSERARTTATLAGWALVIAQVLKANPLPGASVDVYENASGVPLSSVDAAANAAANKGTAAATGKKTPAGGAANSANNGTPTKG